MNGKAIITERDFCDNYNQRDLLKQKDEFWIFARNNWFFMSPVFFSHYCYSVYQRAKAKQLKVGDDFTKVDHWVKFYELDTSLEADSNSKKYREELGKIHGSLTMRQADDLRTLFAEYLVKKRYNWHNSFFEDASVLLLSFVHMNRLSITAKASAKDNNDFSEFVALTDVKTELSDKSVNGKIMNTFKLKYDADFRLDYGNIIRSKRLTAVSDDVVLQIVCAQDTKNVLWEKKLKKEEDVWVNTVGDTVVSVIEDRYLDNECKKDKLPEGAYSIVELSRELFVYLLDGKLQHNGYTSAIDEKWYSYSGSFVELSLINGRLYALNDRGSIYVRYKTITEKTVSLSRLGGRNEN